MKTISEETVLLPEIIAEGITQDKTEIEYLVNRAEMHFKNSDHFRKSITAKGNKGRDNLYMFMAHWIEAYRIEKSKGFNIYVDNSIARSFNVNIDSPSFFCFAQNEDEAIQKMKESDFKHKDKEITSIHSF
jgi:hypothetical protein